MAYNPAGQPGNIPGGAGKPSVRGGSTNVGGSPIFVSKDKSQPYFGMEVYADKSGNIRPVQQTTTTYTTKGGYSTTNLAAATNQSLREQGAQPSADLKSQMTQSMMRGMGLSADVLPVYPRGDYTLKVNDKAVKVSPGLAYKVTREGLPSEPQVAGGEVHAAKRSGLLKAGLGAAETAIAPAVESGRSVLFGDNSVYQRTNKGMVDLFIDPNYKENIQYFNQRFARGSSDPFATVPGSIIKGFQTEVAEQPLKLGLEYAGGKALGYGLGVLGESASAGAMKLYELAPETIKAGRLTLTGVPKGVGLITKGAGLGLNLAGLGLVAASGISEYERTGGITSTFVSVAGMEQGAELGVRSKLAVKIRPKELQLASGSKGAEVLSNEGGRQAITTTEDLRFIQKNEYVWNDKALGETKSFTEFNVNAKATSILGRQGVSESVLDLGITKQKLRVDARGIILAESKPEVFRATGVNVGVTRELPLLNAPEGSVLDLTGRTPMLTGNKALPTTFSAFEVRNPANPNEVIMGVSKSVTEPDYLQIGEAKMVRQESLSFNLGKKAVGKGYELNPNPTGNIVESITENLYKPISMELAGAKPNIRASKTVSYLAESSSLSFQYPTVGTPKASLEYIPKGESLRLNKVLVEFPTPKTYGKTIYEGKSMQLGNAAATPAQAARAFEGLFQPTPSKPLGPKIMPGRGISGASARRYPKRYETIGKVLEFNKELDKLEAKVPGIFGSKQVTSFASEPPSLSISQQRTELVPVRRQTTGFSDPIGISQAAVQELGQGQDLGSLLGTRFAGLQKQNLRQKNSLSLRLMGEQAVDYSLMQSLEQPQQFRQPQIQRQVTPQVITNLYPQIERQDLVQTPGQIYPPFSITPNPPPPITPPEFAMPSLAMPLQLFGRGRSKKVTFKPEYFASIEATAFGIKGKRPGKGELMTGLNIRPILR